MKNNSFVYQCQSKHYACTGKSFKMLTICRQTTNKRSIVFSKLGNHFRSILCTDRLDTIHDTTLPIQPWGKPLSAFQLITVNISLLRRGAFQKVVLSGLGFLMLQKKYPTKRDKTTRNTFPYRLESRFTVVVKNLLLFMLGRMAQCKTQIPSRQALARSTGSTPCLPFQSTSRAPAPENLLPLTSTLVQYKHRREHKLRGLRW